MPEYLIDLMLCVIATYTMGKYVAIERHKAHNALVG